MGNYWKDYNFRLCAEYKSIIYQLHDISDVGDPDVIDTEFSEERCSQELCDWLSDENHQIKLFCADAFYWGMAGRERKTQASQKLVFWSEVLETYLNTKRDTPSCVQLWKWGCYEHKEYRSIEEKLSKWNIQYDIGGKQLHYRVGDVVAKKTFDKFFERHIHTKSIYPESERRKLEDFQKKLMKSIKRSKK